MNNNNLTQKKPSKNRVIGQKDDTNAIEHPQSSQPQPQHRKKHYHHNNNNTTTKEEYSESNSHSKASKNKADPKQIKDLIAECFVLLNEIGHGAFGQIFLSFNMRDNIEVAIKKELKKPQKIPQLRTEAKIYQTLLNIPLNSDLSGTTLLHQEAVQGISKFYGMGELNDCYYMIIEFLGPNLIELLNYCGYKRFTIATVCLLSLQIINRIENLHKHHFIHRDIKPENFLIGTEDKSNIVYLIDFGLSKRYKNPKNHQHIPYREGRLLTGTARYVSINTHLGIEQSRRDDLESIGYVIVFFLKGILPWQGLKGGNDKYVRIMEKKLQIPTEILCYGLPDEFSSYLNYCKSLRFEDRPDYDYLRGLFIRLLGTCTTIYGITREYLKFDWCFEDQNMLWQFYSGENKGGNANNVEDKAKKLCNVKEIEDEQEQLQENNKNKDNEDSNERTNENNPNIINSKSSSSIKDLNDFIIKKDVNADGEDDESGNTIKLEFNGQCQAEVYNSKINQPGIKPLFNNNNNNNNTTTTNSINNNDQPFIEDIDSYINNLMQGCKLAKTITITDIKKRTTVRNNNNNLNSNNNMNCDKSVDTIENKHQKPQNINQILNKVKQNTDYHHKNKEKDRNKSKNNSISEISGSASKDSVSLFNEKQQNKDINNDDTNIDQPKSIPITITKDPIITTLEDQQIIFNFTNTKKSTKKMILDNTTESFENKINPKFKSIKNTSESFSHEMKLAKENLIKLNNEPITKYYTILNDVGQGAYGKVKRVRHKHLNEIRAMKIVNKKSISSSNEIEILRKISHPNILNIFEIFEDSSKYSIMSEYCEGGELFDAITQRGFFTEIDAAKVMKQILQAVNYMHDIGIVHRDLKPENIMLLNGREKDKDAKGRSKGNYDLKIIDFGTAVDKPSKGKKLKKFIGTSYYIAPEVINESYDEKCDVWSCGIILFILLCGYPPFNGSTNADIYHAIQYNILGFAKDEWSEVSREALNLIQSMLIKQPDKRPTAEDCLNDQWFKICLQSKTNDALMQKNKKAIIERMALFVEENKFKQAVLQFITTEFNLKKEEEEMRNMFKEFDKEEKGTISKEAFLAQIDKLYGENIVKEIALDVFAKLDLDGSGTISYNEFLTSIIDSKKIITIDKLERAFKLFDKDENGLLSVEEIRSFFGGDESVWKNVLKEVDTNGDGEVDFEEFKVLMMGMDPYQIVGDNNTPS